MNRRDKGAAYHPLFSYMRNKPADYYDREDLESLYDAGKAQLVYENGQARYVPISRTLRIPIPDKK